MPCRIAALATAVIILVVAPALAAANASDSFETTNLTPPAAVRGFDPVLAAGFDGPVGLVWLESDASGNTALRFSSYDAAARRWSASVTIAARRAVCGPPSLAVGRAAHRTAAWIEGSPATRVCVSFSTDAGVSWSPPQSLTRATGPKTSLSLCALADGRTLALWIDGHGPAARFCARIVEQDNAAPDAIVAAAASEAGPTALAAFPDGSALAAFRCADSDGKIKARFARFEAGAWQQPYSPFHDGIRPEPGLPPPGPVLGANSAHVAAAWFGAAEDGPGLLTATSPDAGERWLIPSRLGSGAKPGRLAAAVLADGTACLVWIEPGASGKPGTLWLETLEASGPSGPPVMLAPSAAVAEGSQPSLAVVRERDTSAAQLLLACAADDGGGPRLATRLLFLPPPPARTDPCNCDTVERGFALRGRIDAVFNDRGAVRVAFDRIPGIMPAGTREFKAAPEVIAALPTGREILARIEPRGRAWWLFDVRLLRPPAP
jgi:hypothetical protein